MSEGFNTDTSTQKVKTLSVFIPTAAVLVLSAMLATPWLAAVPVYAGGDDECDKDKDKDKCKDDKKNEKVPICHVPPGNPDNVHLITISENAVNAHLAHGDFFPDHGKCDKKDDCKDKNCDCKDKDKCDCDCHKK
jgi:hypothetical protein